MNVEEDSLIVITGPTLSGKTKVMLNILEELAINKIPTIFFCFEIPKKQILKIIEEADNTSVVIGNTNYIEEICSVVKQGKFKIVLIDGLSGIVSKYRYCLGKSDILSIFLKQLRDLSIEQNIPIILTGPDNLEDEVKNIDTLDIKTIKINSARKHQDRF